MNTEHRKYPLLNKDLVTASLALSVLSQYLKQEPTPEVQAAIVNSIAEQAAKLDLVLWHQNHENGKVVEQHKIQLGFARHPIRSAAELSQAPLSVKRETLNAMAIVPVSVAASYLGVAKHTIYNLPYYAGIPPWDKYLGVQPMSINQIMLLAKNPEFCQRRHVEIQPQACVDTILDHLIMVSEETAQAYINAPYAELLALTKRTYIYRPRFRLSDLEKIRVAKLAKKPA